MSELDDLKARVELLEENGRAQIKAIQHLMKTGDMTHATIANLTLIVSKIVGAVK